MKKLSIVEKAKAYDNVRDKIAIRFGSNIAKEIFSEHEESEDLEKTAENYGIRQSAELKSFARYKVGDTIYYSLFGKLVGFVIANIVEDGTDNPKYENKNGDCIFQNDIIEPTTRLIKLNKSLRKIYYSSSRKPY